MIFNMTFLCFLFLMSISPAQAGLHMHGQPGPTGFSQVNVAGGILGDLNGGLINAMKTAAGPSFSNGASPSQLDANGLPKSALTSTQAISFNLSFLDSQTSAVTTWVYKWTPGGAAVHFLNVGIDATVQTGCAVSSNGFTSTITMTAGTSCRVEFTFHTLPGQNVNTQFTAAAYAAGSNELVLCRKTDEAALTAGSVTTPEYQSRMKSSGIRTLRMMPFVFTSNSNLTNQSKWAYRTVPTSLGYNMNQFPPGVQGGTIAGTDTYTGSAAPDTPGSWTANEVYQGTVTNANTSTTPTLNIAGRGAKTIVDATAGVLGVGEIVAGSLATFVYDAILDKVLYSTTSGIASSIPTEVQVKIANELNVNLWINIPQYVDDAYVSSLAAVVRDNLNPQLTGYFAYGNEIWNGAFPGTAWSSARATALGFSQLFQSWYSLRVRQIMGNITTVWTASRSQASLRRVIEWQAFGDSGVTTYRFNSTELAPSGVSTGTGNALYSSYTGSANYTTPGQRAIDFADVGAYATYFAGASITGGGYAPTPYETTVIQNLANLFNANANDPTALAILDNDIRQGTTSNITISSVSGTTINAAANGFANGNEVVFTTTGTIYTGLSLNKVYYVVSAAANSFSVSATFGGAAISLSGGSGTNTVGVLGFETLLNLSQTIYRNPNGNTSTGPGWETVAATYDAFRTGAGQAKLSIEAYEGGLEIIAPTTAECTAMGVTVGGSAATASAALTAGIAAYKNNVNGYNIALSQFNQYVGKDATDQNFGLLPHSKVPSWFMELGGNQWSKQPGALDTTPFQTYNGVAAFIFP